MGSTSYGEIKVKPAIYRIEWRGKDPRQNWGWVILDELAEIIGCPSAQKEELLLKFERAGGFRRRRWSGERNKLVHTATGEHRTTSVEHLTCSGIMFVPAGWALAVIEEITTMRTRPEKLQRELEKATMQRERIEIAKGART